MYDKLLITELLGTITMCDQELLSNILQLVCVEIGRVVKLFIVNEQGLHVVSKAVFIISSSSLYCIKNKNIKF